MKINLNLSTILFSLSLKDKMLFARNLEIMIRSGMQLLQGLEILKKQTRSKAMINILDHLIADIKNGHFLSAGLERYRNLFGDFFINLIRVGETSGTLSDNLKYLAEELEKKAELQSKIRGALAYPIIIVIATIGITGILSFAIFPKILPVLTSINVELPITTRIFIAASQFILAYGQWLALGLFALAVLAWLFLKIQHIRLAWHHVLLYLPITGSMSRNVNLINFSRTMNLLLRGGIQIVEALEISAETLTNLVYKNHLKLIANGVRRGDPISKYLHAKPRMYPPTFAELIFVGENTGKLDETVVFLASFYESELDTATRTMTNVLEPLLLLMMGFVVAFIALAIITPIYKITQTLGR